VSGDEARVETGRVGVDTGLMQRPRRRRRAQHFWRFAARLKRRPRALISAIAMAFVSAGGLGVGLIAIVPMLNIVFQQGDGALASEARRLADSWGVTLPAGVLNALPTTQMASVIWIVIAMVFLTILGSTANFLHQYLSLTLTARVTADIRRDVFRHVLHMPLSKIAGDANDAVSRMLNDTQALQLGLMALTSRVVAQMTKGLAAFVAALLIDWRLTLLALLIAPILYTIIRKLGKRIRRASRGVFEERARLMGVASESLQGLRVVKTYSAEREQLGRFSRHNREALRQELRARTAKALSTPLTEMLAIIAMGGLAILAASWIITSGLSPGVFLGALAALGAAGASLKPLSNLVQTIQASDAAAQRLAELLDSPGEATGPRARRDGGKPRLARHRESVGFEDVVFAYPKAEAPALSGVSLRIEAGETVAFVGPNGSGKTTLLSLVPRLFNPDSGRITIDAVDIASVDLTSLRRQIGVVTQEVVLFRGTIRENIAFGRLGVTDADIERAAQAARADEFIRAKPGAYEAEVGEGGVSLSGGQRQRIAIARAILRDPAILILDEATSMIDAESEQMIGEAIAEFTRGRTCLIVAHRLSTVRTADRIVVMDAGRIVDIGRHDDLLDRCDVYRRIAQGQLIEAPAGA